MIVGNGSLLVDLDNSNNDCQVPLESGFVVCCVENHTNLGIMLYKGLLNYGVDVHIQQNVAWYLMNVHSSFFHLSIHYSVCLSICMYVCWSQSFPCIILKMCRRNFIEFGMLTYSDHLQISIRLWSCSVDFPNGSVMILTLWNVDVSWPPSGLVIFWVDIINTLRRRQNGRHFADDTFKCIFFNKNVRILIKNSLKFVPKGQINNIPSLIQIMAWRWPGDNPLSEPMMVRLPMHICVTRPQWVNVGTIFTWDNVLFLNYYLGMIANNNHSYGMILSQAWNSDYLFRIKRGKFIIRRKEVVYVRCLSLSYVVLFKILSLKPNNLWSLFYIMVISVLP